MPDDAQSVVAGSVSGVLGAAGAAHAARTRVSRAESIQIFTRPDLTRILPPIGNAPYIVDILDHYTGIFYGEFCQILDIIG